jgi:hypothetical protein
MIFAGYHEPRAIVRGIFTNKIGLELQMGDPNLLITEDMQANRLQRVQRMLQHAPEKREVIAAGSGIHGACAFVEQIPYIEFNTCALPPFGHAWDRGVYRDLVLEATKPPSKQNKGPNAQLRPLGANYAQILFPSSLCLTAQQRQEVETRGTRLVLTHDFTKPYRCLLKRGSAWSMEEWMRGCDVIVRMLLAQVSDCPNLMCLLPKLAAIAAI